MACKPVFRDNIGWVVECQSDEYEAKLREVLATAAALDELTGRTQATLGGAPMETQVEAVTRIVHDRDALKLENDELEMLLTQTGGSDFVDMKKERDDLKKERDSARASRDLVTRQRDELRADRDRLLLETATLKENLKLTSTERDRYRTELSEAWAATQSSVVRGMTTLADIIATRLADTADMKRELDDAQTTISKIWEVLTPFQTEFQPDAEGNPKLVSVRTGIHKTISPYQLAMNTGTSVRNYIAKKIDRGWSGTNEDLLHWVQGLNIESFVERIT